MPQATPDNTTTTKRRCFLPLSENCGTRSKPARNDWYVHDLFLRTTHALSNSSAVNVPGGTPSAA
jgi:hypothetical protein